MSRRNVGDVDIAEVLDMIVGKVPGLRAAGVTGRVTVGDISFVIGDAATEETAATEDEIDPTTDPNAWKRWRERDEKVGS